MAQARVTEFFSAKKRNSNVQPSGRGKLMTSEVETNIYLPNQTNKRTTRGSDLPKTVVDIRPENLNVQVPEGAAKSTSGTKRSLRVKSKGNKSKTRSVEKNQSTIKDAFSNTRKNCSKDSDNDLMSEDVREVTRSEEVTSTWDEHDGQQTPIKNCPQKNDISATDTVRDQSRKRSRKGKVITVSSGVSEYRNALSLTPEKELTETATCQPRINHKAKKRLALKSDSSSHSESHSSDTESLKDFIMQKGPKAISPLPATPDNVHSPTSKGPTEPVSAQVKMAIEKCKTLLSAGDGSTTAIKRNTRAKPSAAQIKAQLSKCGGLEELKAQLSKMNETKAKLKKPVPKLQKFDEVEVEVKETEGVVPKQETKAPAFERFHTLATETAPTLSLPYKYKLLLEMFRGMDTVVSMLHNRAEICTFSKLKVAVQQITKRNFEEKNVGQIKNVYPSAYVYRQEKGLPSFGKKTTGYQLTVEANLEDADCDIKATKHGKPIFSATSLLRRRNHFNVNLIGIVKQHHKEFLSKLSRPMNIPDHKLTRWHPKFALDEVPDVEWAELPQAPNVKVYQTAKDVLQDTRGRLLPKVEQALENVAKSSPSLESKEPNTNPSPKASANTVTSGLYSGIPKSLLDKIRAKEAQKLESILTRDPKEDRKTEMLKKLPDMMRMLRNCFVTEKRPAILMDTVVQTLVASNRTCISLGDVEDHVKMMLELVPEWLTLVEIKKGRYLRVDKNMDLQVLDDKIQNIIKGRH